MTGYSFAKKEHAMGLLELLRESDAPRGYERPVGLPVQVQTSERISHGFILFTPSGGIPGRSGSTPGVAECEPWFIDAESGELEVLTDDDGNAQTYDVYHLGEGPIGGNRFIQAKLIYGVLVADMEDCP